MHLLMHQTSFTGHAMKDGDFAILFEYFVKMKKEIIVIANARRTAREIKQLKGIQFDDFGSLRQTLTRK